MPGWITVLVQRGQQMLYTLGCVISCRGEQTQANVELPCAELAQIFSSRGCYHQRIMG
jgi:hypothetical protein